MKKLALVFAVLLIASPVLAEHYELTFTWEQAEADLPNLEKWTLYMSGGQSIDIDYTEGAGPDFTSTQEFVLDVTPGVPLEKVFHLTAWSKNGTESEPSNSVSYVFETEHPNVTAPQVFRITGVVKVE